MSQTVISSTLISQLFLTWKKCRSNCLGRALQTAVRILFTKQREESRNVNTSAKHDTRVCPKQDKKRRYVIMGRPNSWKWGTTSLKVAKYAERVRCSKIRQVFEVSYYSTITFNGWDKWIRFMSYYIIFPHIDILYLSIISELRIFLRIYISINKITKLGFIEKFVWPVRYSNEYYASRACYIFLHLGICHKRNGANRIQGISNIFDGKEIFTSNRT